MKRLGILKTPVLLVRHRNQRITIKSTPSSPLSIRSWPKLRIGSVEMTKMLFCTLGDVTRSDSPTSDSFDLVAGYYNLETKLLQADQRLFNRFKKTHVEKSILAVIPATSCSAERSFSGLRRLKTYLRNTMG